MSPLLAVKSGYLGRPARTGRAVTRCTAAALSSGSLAVRRVHTVIVGDSLASVAYTEYGDPTLWRDLAAFNRVDDPLRIPLGTVLMVPTAAELTAPVGLDAR